MKGAYNIVNIVNIVRKVLPDAFGKGIAGAAVHLVRLLVRTKHVA